MNSSSFIKILVLSAVLGYLACGESEAKSLADNRHLKGISPEDLNAMAQIIERASLEQENNDEDDDEDDRSNLQLQNPLQATPSAATASLYYTNSPEPILQDQNQMLVPASTQTDLKTSASHHHHGHGVKGWLDMGAWTGKKGAFGWHDKHPVGGKGRK